MIIAIATITILLSLFYASFVGFLLYQWRKLNLVKVPKKYLPTIGISVIIPARNEASNIKECITSILNNEFPDSLYEIIVVDDQSTDGTANEVAALKNKKVKLKAFEGTNNGGKKEALRLGIAIAQFEIIAQTDADTLVSKEWLRNISYLIEVEAYSLVTGPIVYSKPTNALSAFQALEVLGLMLMTAVGISKKLFFMANGANMSFTKSSFIEVENLREDQHLASGDDVFLIQSLRKKKLGFVKSVSAVATTDAMFNWKDFINQRIRWANKTEHYKDTNLKLTLLLIFIYILLIFCSLVIGLVIESMLLHFFFVSLLIKMVADFYFLREASRFFNQAYLMKYFLPSFFIQTIYMGCIGIAGIFLKKYVWKGRVNR